MSTLIEKVFIAWGGNQDIAKIIRNELSKHSFDGIVGGGTSTDLFIGTKVFSQINQCTHAIILVGNTRLDESYFQKAKKYFEETIKILNESAKKYPQEAVYTKIYEGYVYCYLWRLHKSINNYEKVFEYISVAARSYETFYLYYQQCYPNDGVLIKHFGKEYYLNCAERLKFVKDPIERKIAENTIRSFLEKLENDSGRQHIMLNQLRSAFKGKE